MKAARARMIRLTGWVLAVILISGPWLFGRTFTGKCVAVYDGDTIGVMYQGREARIRLEGIDCPEYRQAYGRSARRFASRALFGKEVEVKVTDVDAYGRWVGRVYVDGEDVCLALVSAGLAWHYKHYSNDVGLAKAEQKARRQHKGLWSDAHPIAPWVWRRQHPRRKK